MTKQERKIKLEELHEYWLNKIAEATEANDQEALQEAKANYDNTVTELLKLQPKPKN